MHGVRIMMIMGQVPNIPITVTVSIILSLLSWTSAMSAALHWQIQLGTVMLHESGGLLKLQSSEATLLYMRQFFWSIFSAECRDISYRPHEFVLYSRPVDMTILNSVWPYIQLVDIFCGPFETSILNNFWSYIRRLPWSRVWPKYKKSRWSNCKFPGPVFP